MKMLEKNKILQNLCQKSIKYAVKNKLYCFLWYFFNIDFNFDIVENFVENV